MVIQHDIPASMETWNIPVILHTIAMNNPTGASGL